MLTLRYFVAIEYRPTLVTVLENSGLHALTIVFTILYIIAQCRRSIKENKEKTDASKEEEQTKKADVSKEKEPKIKSINDEEKADVSKEVTNKEINDNVV